MDKTEEISFRSYSKVDDAAAADTFRRKSRKRRIIVALSAVALVAISAALLIGILVPINSDKTKNTDSNTTSVSSSIKATCNVTRYPDSCYSSMSSALKSSSNGSDSIGPKDLFLLSLRIAQNELKSLSFLPETIISSQIYINETNDPMVRSALYDCETLFSDAVDHIEDAISAVRSGQRGKIDDIRTWLSTAITDQETCLQGVKDIENHLIITEVVKSAMANSTEFTSNSLAIATKIMTVVDDLNITTVHRRLLAAGDRFPTWVRRRDRRLLAERGIRADVTVALDGSGDVKSINEAVRLIPKRSKKRFVIYVKEGLYLGNVTIEKNCWNVMMYGDGMNRTIVSASNNAVEGATTFFSGTFIVDGRGFIAKDMGFINAAGPEKHQAVALRSSSDKSIFYRCSFDAFQDTLYTHSNRQFYRDCQITGTVDFIFGNSASIFQNCTIRPRQPGPKQFNTITAQSKSDPNQNTGISIQRSRLIPLDDLTAPTYLGRPWRDYATTVIMESYIGGFLDAEGWATWDADVDTVYYAEYQNVGPGSVTDRRVKWAGVRPNITYEEAKGFTVDNFLQGSQWLSEANVIYDKN